ncbi:MAG: CPBP family intramembrane metalloprotease [Micropruina sp.]|uniref:CPBP family intramembrane glutamic endopeptidase n=1 Tax=Micropruina sp. TaxID=2737536 RepID=UPI0039E453E0
MAESATGSWVDRYVTESTPTGARYDEILLGSLDRPKLRSTAGIVTAILLYFLFAQLVAQLMAWLGWVVLNPGGSYPDWLRSISRFEIPWGMLSGHLALATLIPISLAVVLFVHHRRPELLASVRPWFRWRYLAISMVLAFLLFNLMLFARQLGQPFPALQPQPDYWVFLVVILLTSPLQAAAEEFFFRGYMLQSFNTLASRSPLFGVVCSAALFALFHGTQNLPLFLDRFAFGVLVGVLVVRTGGLEAAIGAHVVNNLMAFSYAGLYSTIAQVKATQVIGWIDLAWDLGGFAVFTVLAILIGRRMQLAVTTPGRRTLDGVDPWEQRP